MRESQETKRRVIYGAVAMWVVMRGLAFLTLGYQRGDDVDLQDVNLFSGWSELMLSTRSLPGDTSWQYPPGSVGIFMLPGLFPVPHGVVYVALFFLCDLAVLLMLLRAERRTRLLGTWLWIFGIALLLKLPLLRFDLVPTAIAVAALLAIRAGRAPAVVGAIVGVGAAVKAWPVLMVVAITRRSSMYVALTVATAVGVIATGVVQVVFGDALSFLEHQAGRGLQIESVGATPWYALQAVVGTPVVWEGRNGSLELISAKANAVASVLHLAMFVVAVLIATVWFLATRRVPPDDDRARRFGVELAYVAVLAYVVLSPVLSPQYFVWLLGIGAVVLTMPDTRLTRPVCLMAASVVLTALLLSTWGGLVSNGADAAYFLVARNVLLVIALADACIRLWPDVREMWTFGTERTRQRERREGTPVANIR